MYKSLNWQNRIFCGFILFSILFYMLHAIIINQKSDNYCDKNSYDEIVASCVLNIYECEELEEKEEIVKLEECHDGSYNRFYHDEYEMFNLIFICWLLYYVKIERRFGANKKNESVCHNIIIRYIHNISGAKPKLEFM